MTVMLLMDTEAGEFDQDSLDRDWGSFSTSC